MEYVQNFQKSLINSTLFNKLRVSLILNKQFYQYLALTYSEKNNNAWKQGLRLGAILKRSQSCSSRKSTAGSGKLEAQVKWGLSWIHVYQPMFHRRVKFDHIRGSGQSDYLPQLGTEI